jgi:CRP-like cAMP-binding protein
MIDFQEELQESPKIYMIIQSMFMILMKLAISQLRIKRKKEAKRQKKYQLID